MLNTLAIESIINGTKIAMSVAHLQEAGEEIGGENILKGVGAAIVLFILADWWLKITDPWHGKRKP